MDYSPFSKEIKNLEVSDLEALKSVSEGWYVEYKRVVPDASSIAKSISALGNTYGGWVFYGIAERSKQDSVAGEFLGVELEELDVYLQRIRQSVSNRMNPSIHYDCKVLHGPCDVIGLADGKAVICLQVPMTSQAPVVHHSGRVYRRVADGSEPIPEADRFMLDKLWERSREVERRYEEWIDADPGFNERERLSPYIRIMITPSLYDVSALGEVPSLKLIREKFGPGQRPYNHIPFDTITNASNGFLARQCLGNDPTHHVLSWRLRYDLTTEVLLPTVVFKMDADSSRWLGGYNNYSRFRALAVQNKCESANFIDLNMLYPALLAVMDMQMDLQSSLGLPKSFYAKAKIISPSRAIPFLDTDSFVDDVERHGMPVCFDEISLCPPGLKPTSFTKVGDYEGFEEKDWSLYGATILFSFIGRGFGVTSFFEFEESVHIQNFYAAGERAKKVQVARNLNR